MKSLINKIILSLAIITTFSFNSYSQKTEKTKDGFKEYNKKGQLIKETYADNGQKLIIDYKYDEKENKIETIYKIDNENDGKFDGLTQWNYKYDEKGNKIEKIFKKDKENDGKFNYIEQTNLKYDEKGNKIEEIIKEDYENDEKFDILIQYNYKYNEKGKRIETIYKKDKENDGEFDEYEEY
ncbi:MAG TPA: hypothetical protein VJA20_02600 [Candidatus Nanoarchaeia archaeon]|nr:hypothetical protein [Candidatus Nanoarchaeia archaeon]